MAGVAAAVKVDAQGGDHRHGTVDVHQPGVQAVLGAHQHPACHAQGPVQPGGHDHAAVALHRQAFASGRGGLGGFQPPARVVRVGDGHPPSADAVLRHPPGHDGGPVAGDVIPAAGGQVPVIGFFQFGIAGGFQPAGGLGHRVPGGHACPQKGEQAVKGLCILHSEAKPSFSKLTGPGAAGRRPGGRPGAREISDSFYCTRIRGRGQPCPGGAKPAPPMAKGRCHGKSRGGTAPKPP